MFCDGLLLDVRTSAVTKKYWRRSAAFCLVKTTAHRVACLSSSNGFRELVATERSSQIRWGPALCGLSWCCNFFSPPLGARRAGDRLGVLPGGAPAPLGAFSGKWAWAGGG